MNQNSATDGPLTGRCIGCFHDFTVGPCGGCGSISEDRVEPELVQPGHPTLWTVHVQGPDV